MRRIDAVGQDVEGDLHLEVVAGVLLLGLGHRDRDLHAGGGLLRDSLMVVTIPAGTDRTRHRVHGRHDAGDERLRGVRCVPARVHIDLDGISAPLTLVVVSGQDRAAHVVGDGDEDEQVLLVEGEPGLPGHRVRGSARFSLADRKSTRLNSSHVAISYAVFSYQKTKKQYTKK